LSQVPFSQLLTIIGGNSGITDPTGIFSSLQLQIDFIRINSSGLRETHNVGDTAYSQHTDTIDKANELNSMINTLSSLYSINISMASSGQPTGIKATGANSFSIFLDPNGGAQNMGLLMHELTHIHDVKEGNLYVSQQTTGEVIPGQTTLPVMPPEWGFGGVDLYDEQRAHRNQAFVDRGFGYYQNPVERENWINNELNSGRYNNLSWSDSNIWNNWATGNTQYPTATDGGGSTTTPYHGGYPTTPYEN
jgi:hypothetical protein